MLFWGSKNTGVPRSSTSAPPTSTPQVSERRSLQEEPCYVTTPQTAPLLSLPVELLQLITAYLDTPSAAALSLSARYTCYAIGHAHTARYLSSSRTKFDRRKRIEILERAFPSHWYCAWCDRFHVHERAGGPKRFDEEKKRDCAAYNSYLCDFNQARREAGYVLAFHHVRHGVNRAMWGEEYGMNLEDFNYEQDAVSKIFRTKCPTRTRCEAKVVSGHFLLHASYRITLPSTVTRKPHALLALWPTLPHIVVGHRDSNGGHTGLSNCLENALAHNWRFRTQLCYLCATDYAVSCHSIADSATTNSHLVVEIDAWRDLGNGRNPFDTSWRSHGENGDGMPGFGGDMLRLTNLLAGEIRKAFERGGPLRHVSGSLGAGPRPASRWHGHSTSLRNADATVVQETRQPSNVLVRA
ncbi:hypothetical protein BS50DRAFT_577859 [Corynespora cassiicola Philippines]|uniref:F-box domain-containing protein n=1 Tax=Corynespora cassiicola Philippines TaxID=1448308 RepID=A0A2T2NAA0_CORCC|nr:hypothetical protein BS50DRAFT_577859 [Corynespora cassiicola Philippines]